MASLTTTNVNQNNYEKWSYKRMQELIKYLGTYNCESQVVATSGTVALATTGTKLVFMNGQPMYLAADAEMVIATSDPEPDTAWVTATAYSVGDIRVDDYSTRFRCISAHTSEMDNEPHKGDRWTEKWETAPHGAVTAVGTSITTAYDQWFLVTAIADGTLQIWEAGDEAATGTAECKVPQFDPKRYVALGFVHIANASGSAFVVGTTSFAGVTETYLQIVGPVFPHEDNWDAN